MTEQATGPPCRDPACVDPDTGRRSRADIESDGHLTYQVCPVCGYESGHRLAGDTDPGTPGGGPESGTRCPVGIPEHLRRAASPAGPGGPAPVLLQIGRRPDAAA